MSKQFSCLKILVEVFLLGSELSNDLFFVSHFFYRGSGFYYHHFLVGGCALEHAGSGGGFEKVVQAAAM